MDELLELVRLSPYRKRALGKYSGGMKQRFGIAQALIGDPQLLIVDGANSRFGSRRAGAFLQYIK